VFGSACVDLLMQPDRLPRPGVTVLAPTYELLPGGKGANQAHACAMACENETSVHFVGAVGKDAFGDSLRAAFLDANVGVSGLVTHATLPTACAAVIVDTNGENQIAVGSGANNAVTTAQLGIVEKDAKAHTLVLGDVLLQQMEIPMEEVRKAVEIARLIGAFSVLNVAPSAPVPEETLRKLDFLVVNEHEAADVFASLSETNEVARDVAERFLKTSQNAEKAVAQSAAIASTTGVAVIVTLGAEGAAACLPTRPSLARVGEKSDASSSGPISQKKRKTILTRVDVLRVSALALVGDERVVDTTGAGDAFVGAFCASLASRRSLPDCLKRASVAGTLGCTRVGARAGVPRIDEIEKRAVGVAVVADWGDHVDEVTAASTLAAPAAAWTRRGV
jgi:ribokinase